MRKFSKQSGFAVLEIILILVIVGIVGFTGRYVWHSQKNANKTYDNASKSSQSITAPSKKSSSDTSSTTQNTSTAPAQTQGYLAITEWGIKLVFADADKVTYSISSDNFGSAVPLRLRDSVTTIESCKGLGVGVVRTTNVNDTLNGGGGKKIGNYYYRIGGGPGACTGDTESGPINTLRSKILQEFNANTVQAL
jgi:type II secretory pathway pseudopilin PulG